MDKIDWIEFAKIAGGVLTAAAGIATVGWQAWRKIDKLRRKVHDLEVRNQKLQIERDHAIERRDWHKNQTEALREQQAKTRSQWKVNFQEKFAERHAEYLANHAQRDKFIATIKRDIAASNSQIADLRSQLSDTMDEIAALRTTLDQRAADLAEARRETDRHAANEEAVTHQLVEARTQIDQLELTVDGLETDRAGLRVALTDALAARDELEERFNSVLKFDGRLWNLPVAAGASVPEFRPARNRRMPIVSVLNFKGGVGKTSITVNLAGFVGQQGKRTLMIDLDYQRSLSQLVLTNRDRKTLRLERRCLQHFLAGEQHDVNYFLDFAHRIEKGMPACWILPNSNATEVHGREESLDETENQMMAEWIVNRDSARDVRFLLREALHGTGIESQFDYVLLDCPPRLSLSTINALAASDYVLVPVLLDELSANSVLPLVTALREFRSLFPHLKMLGVVANRARFYGSGPVGRQAETWESLKRECGVYRDYPVRFFETIIPDNKSFGKACGDDGPSLAIEDAAIDKAFRNLLDEIEKEIDSHAHSHS